MYDTKLLSLAFCTANDKRWDLGIVSGNNSVLGVYQPSSLQKWQLSIVAWPVHAFQKL